MFNFQNAGDTQSFTNTPIPKGTLARVCLQLQSDNFGNVVHNSGQTQATFLKGKVTILGGEHERRVVFVNIGLTDANGGTSGEFAQHGAAMIKAILEGNGACEDPAKYNIQSYADLHGRTAYVRIGQETDRYNGVPQIKNVIEAFLSPNVNGPTYEEYTRAYNEDNPQGQPQGQPV